MRSDRAEQYMAVVVLDKHFSEREATRAMHLAESYGYDVDYCEAVEGDAPGLYRCVRGALILETSESVIHAWSVACDRARSEEKKSRPKVGKNYAIGVRVIATLYSTAGDPYEICGVVTMRGRDAAGIYTRIQLSDGTAERIHPSALRLLPPEPPAPEIGVLPS